MNATQQKQLVKRLTTELGHEPTPEEVKQAIANLAAQAAPKTTAKTATKTAKTEAPAAPESTENKRPARPEGFKPTYGKVGQDALVYGRVSKATGHIIEIWDSTHPKTPDAVKSLPGNGRFVAVDLTSGVSHRHDKWSGIYAKSRSMDGETFKPAPYIAKHFEVAQAAKAEAAKATPQAVKEQSKAS